MVCSLSLKPAGSDDEHSMIVAAVHLPSGMDQARVRSRFGIVEEIVSKFGDTGVLILGDTNCKDEEAGEVCKRNHLREASYTGYSWGSRSNRYDASFEYEGCGIRYDRMLSSGSGWAESFLVGNRKTFFEGYEFFLSDHFLVVGFFGCHPVFRESGRASTAIGELAELVWSLFAIADSAKSSMRVLSC